MAKSDLLAEAIADAKRVKSTALANAKIVLEEAFQPTLQRMISTKLAEEEGDEDDFDLNIEIEPEGGDESAPPAAPAGDIGMGSFSCGEDEEAPVEDEEPDQELESLIRELECSDDELPDEGENDLFGEGQEEDWGDPIQEGDEFEDTGEDDTELTEAEVRALSTLFEEEGLGDVDGPEDEDGGAFTLDGFTREPNHESRSIRRQNAKLKKDLNEVLREVTLLKKTINDVNLLNAKLMFTTRALRSGSLTESQGVRVMNQIDLATSVREVKLIYTTILGALNKGKQPRRQMTEGLASKSTNLLKPKGALYESKNSDVIKWQRLAGILPPADF